MGVLVESMETGEFTFYLKGADSVMVRKLGENEKIFVLEETEILSSQGIYNIRVKNIGIRLKINDQRPSE